MTLKFFITDVFANNPYEGNQLAVFIDLEQQLSNDQMQTIAREINFAETTFIRENKSNDHFGVRIFTPEHEVPFAGHPSIGTSYIISKVLLPGIKSLVLELVHADIVITIMEPAAIDESIIFMQQAPPVFGETFTHDEVAAELGISADSLDRTLPVQEISTGLPYIVVPLKNLAAIENIQLQYGSFKTFLEKRNRYRSNSVSGHSTSLFFFTGETYEPGNTYNTRMLLLENNRLCEDAATGSANGCFLAYLLKYRNPKITAVTEQGFQMKRRSYLYLNGEVNDGVYQLNVGGRSKLIAEGNWYL